MNKLHAIEIPSKETFTKKANDCLIQHADILKKYLVEKTKRPGIPHPQNKLDALVKFAEIYYQIACQLDIISEEQMLIEATAKIITETEEKNRRRTFVPATANGGCEVELPYQMVEPEPEKKRRYIYSENCNEFFTFMMHIKHGGYKWRTPMEIALNIEDIKECAKIFEDSPWFRMETLVEDDRYEISIYKNDIPFDQISGRAKALFMPHKEEIAIID